MINRKAWDNRFPRLSSSVHFALIFFVVVLYLLDLRGLHRLDDFFWNLLRHCSFIIPHLVIIFQLGHICLMMFFHLIALGMSRLFRVPKLVHGASMLSCPFAMIFTFFIEMNTPLIFAIYIEEYSINKKK
jgi:hypothetical protein